MSSASFTPRTRPRSASPSGWGSATSVRSRSARSPWWSTASLGRHAKPTLDRRRTPDDNPPLSMPSLLTRVFGSANERTLRRLWPIVEEMSGLEADLQALPPEAFPARTAELRQRLAAEETTLDEILPEAFAPVREASRRTIGLRPFDAQATGGGRPPPRERLAGETRG